MSTNHEQYMTQALELARKALGRTAPNPPVGAVIVRDGAVVGRGFHPRAGEPHAEIFALADAAEKAAGADIYVTLEPCSHFGKTPPCADALIAAGVARVFVGTADPNPQVAGRGLSRLRAAGIEVHCGPLEGACRELIAPFCKHILTGLPYTIYKTAMTADGNTATHSGDSRWVSGTESRQLVHRLRDQVDAIMVGIETLLSDDPLLNVRLPDQPESRDPVRIVVDSRLRIPLECRMLQQQSNAVTLVATCCEKPDKIAALEQLGCQVLLLPGDNGRVDLAQLWSALGQRNIQSLLLEGGPTLASAAVARGLVDRLMLFVAPKLLVGRSGYSIFSAPGCDTMAQALPLHNWRYQSSGEDLLITGDLQPCSQD